MNLVCSTLIAWTTCIVQLEDVCALLVGSAIQTAYCRVLEVWKFLIDLYVRLGNSLII